MSTLTVKVGKTTLKLTDRDYVAAGGQAAVYKKADKALKIYHDRGGMIPAGKITELMAINDDAIIRPLEMIFDESGVVCGYTMRFVGGTEPVCKLFTKAFKVQHGIEPDQSAKLVEALRKRVVSVHAARCLAVDLNEMNVLIPDTFDDAFMIDTDSFQTPSYRATAIMESIRDRQGKRGVFSEGTDWFSWAVTTFNLQTNVHPYKGTHPNYKPSEWSRRMDDNVSVFDKDVKLPPIVIPFTVIESRLLDWYRAVFIKGERSTPPALGVPAPVPVPAAGMTIVQGTSTFNVAEIMALDGPILSVLSLGGHLYCATKKHVYVGTVALPVDLKGSDAVHLLKDSKDNLLVGVTRKGVCTVTDQTGTKTVATLRGRFFSRDGRLYCLANGSLQEQLFINFGSTTVASAHRVDNVLELSATIHDGLVVQVLLGRHYLTVPYDTKKCCNVAAPALDGRRVVSAKASGKFVVVLSEKGGKYRRTGFAFDDKWQISPVFEDEDVPYENICFSAMSDKMAAVLVAPDKLRLFAKGAAKEYDDPPVDTSMRLFPHLGDLHFVSDNSVFKLSFKTR